MSERESDHLEYRSIQTGAAEWSVFVVDDRAPNWWQVVAKFASQGRADDYAAMENEFADMSDLEPLQGREDTRAPHPARQLPPSNLTPQTITRRESIAHTRIEREETVTTVAEPQRQQIEAPAPASAPEAVLVYEPAPQVDEIIVQVNKLAPPVDEASADDPLPEPVDCATLDDLTRPQMDCLKVLIEARGQYVSTTELVARAGSSAPGALPALVKKGYVRKRSIGSGRKAYDILFYGAPRLMEVWTWKENPSADQSPVPVQESPENDDISDAGEDVPEGLADASKLEPITKRQASIFEAVGQILDVGEIAYESAIAKRSGNTNVGDALWTLEKKGYVERLTEGNRAHYTVTAEGTPTIAGPRDSRGELVRQWTDEEVDGLLELAPSLGDTYSKYAEKIGRTEDAVQQKARTMGCFKPSLVTGYAAPKPKRAPVPETSNNTAALMGDPASGRSAAEQDLNAKTYLLRKGHTCSIAEHGLRVDGKLLDKFEVLDLVNRYRAKAELAPLQNLALA